MPGWRDSAISVFCWATAGLATNAKPQTIVLANDCHIRFFIAHPSRPTIARARCVAERFEAS
jgi:hypothetical protein